MSSNMEEEGDVGQNPSVGGEGLSGDPSGQGTMALSSRSESFSSPWGGTIIGAARVIVGKGHPIIDELLRTSVFNSTSLAEGPCSSMMINDSTN